MRASRHLGPRTRGSRSLAAIDIATAINHSLSVNAAVTAGALRVGPSVRRTWASIGGTAPGAWPTPPTGAAAPLNRGCRGARRPRRLTNSQGIQ